MNGTSNQAEPSAVVRTGRRRRLAGAPGGRDRAGSRPGAVARLAPSAGQGEGAMGRQEARSRGDSWAAGDRRPARLRGRQRPGRGRPAARCRVEGQRAVCLYVRGAWGLAESESVGCFGSKCCWAVFFLL